jgi:hypothetical protein
MKAALFAVFVLALLGAFFWMPKVYGQAATEDCGCGSGKACQCGPECRCAGCETHGAAKDGQFIQVCHRRQRQQQAAFAAGFSVGACSQVPTTAVEVPTSGAYYAYAPPAAVVSVEPPVVVPAPAAPSPNLPTFKLDPNTQQWVPDQPAPPKLDAPPIPKVDGWYRWGDNLSLVMNGVQVGGWTRETGFVRKVNGVWENQKAPARPVPVAPAVITAPPGFFMARTPASAPRMAAGAALGACRA